MLLRKLGNGFPGFLQLLIKSGFEVGNFFHCAVDFPKLFSQGCPLLPSGSSITGMEGISSFSLPELTLPHFDGSGWNFPQAALAGGGTTRTTNLGGVYITVNGYNARNDDELAQTVADKINGMIHEDDSVFK